AERLPQAAVAAAEDLKIVRLFPVLDPILRRAVLVDDPVAIEARGLVALVSVAILGVHGVEGSPDRHQHAPGRALESDEPPAAHEISAADGAGPAQLANREIAGQV